MKIRLPESALGVHDMLVKDVLADRSLDTVTVGPKTSVSDAARVMTENYIGAVAVVDANGKIAGILSERDILMAVRKFERPLELVPTDEIMTEKVIICTPDDPIVQVIMKIATLRIRHLLVMDNGELIGVLSMRDVVEILSKLIFEDQILGQRRLATEIVSTLSSA